MASIDLVRVGTGMVLLLVAAALDLRTRRVRDEVWLVMGSMGIALTGVQVAFGPLRWEIAAALASLAILYYKVFWGEGFVGEDGSLRFRIEPALAYVSAGTLLLVAAPTAGGEPLFLTLVSACGVIVVGHVFYQSGLLRGGADAKAFMAIGTMVPAYPALEGLPLLPLDPRAESLLSVVFPFALVALFDAVLLLAALPIALLARNLAKGHAHLPAALLGYAVPVDRVPRFVWLMERMEDGKRTMTYVPRRQLQYDELQRLKDAGATEVWVTPQVPFVVAIAAGFVFAVVIGNPFFALLRPA